MICNDNVVHLEALPDNIALRCEPIYSRNETWYIAANNRLHSCNKYIRVSILFNDYGDISIGVLRPFAKRRLNKSAEKALYVVDKYIYIYK